MLKLHAASFVSAMTALARTVVILDTVTNPQDAQQQVALQLKMVRESLGDLPLSEVVQAQFERTLDKVQESPFAPVEVTIYIREFHNNLVVELSSQCFFRLSPERCSLYDLNEPPFGQEVYDKFLDTQFDIEAAARCYALEEWTACVFHLMRVVEVGLHTLAKRLRVPMARDVDLKQWGEIIREIERAIKKIEGQKRTRARDEKLQFYSEAASNFQHFKNAWRNHVSHVRGKYLEREATTIWSHVQAFMQALAR